MEQQNTQKKKIWKKIVAVAAAVAIVAGGTALYAGASGQKENKEVAAVVSLDVNPSIQMSIDEQERVLEAKALNSDAEAVLGEMDFAGANLEVAMYAVVGSMVKRGYLSDKANSLLICLLYTSCRNQLGQTPEPERYGL